MILQARESASSRPIVAVLVELAHDYSLLLLTAIMHLIRTFTEEALRKVPRVTTRKSTCDLLLCRRMPISYKTRDPKRAGRLQLMVVSPVIPGVTTIVFANKKRQVRILKLN